MGPRVYFQELSSEGPYLKNFPDPILKIKKSKAETQILIKNLKMKPLF